MKQLPHHAHAVAPPRPSRRAVLACLGAVGLWTLAGCGALEPSKTPPPAFYALDNPPGSGAAAPAPMAPSARAPTLIVTPLRAAAGFDSQRIIYVREDHKPEYFAHSEWIDPPARMLGPLVASAIERSGAFRAVVLTPASASGDLRLDTEIVRLQQEFQAQPSQVRFTLKATLVEDRSRRVVAWRMFDSVVPAPSDDPYGGVVAANRAVQNVLAQLAAFCAEAAKTTPAVP